MHYFEDTHRLSYFVRIPRFPGCIMMPANDAPLSLLPLINPSSSFPDSHPLHGRVERVSG